jgi:thiol-disulfide isomerase/thioredoxin
MLASCDKQSAAPVQPQQHAKSEPLAQNGIAAGQPPAPVYHATPGLPGANEQGILLDKFKGQPLPVADFLGVNGKGITLDRFKGRPILLNLWATWCGPCVLEMPTLDRLAQQQADKLQVIVISQDIRGKEVVDPWWTEHKLTLLQPYTDPEDHMLAGLNNGDVGSGSLPTTVLFDKNGKEVWRMLGAMDWTSPRSAELLAEGMR